MLSGRVAIITGASSGIGAAVAKSFVDQGAKVVLNGRNAEKLLATTQACKDYGNTVHQVVGDVCNEGVQKRLVDDAIAKFGRLDILVNNAGMNVVSPIDVGKAVDTTTQMVQSADKSQVLGLNTYDRQFDVCVRQVVGLSAYAIPQLVKTKGNIVNVSSAASKHAVPGSTVYCMSKAALDMFTYCLCAELGPRGVRVNAVNPGAIATNFLIAAGAPKEALERSAQSAAVRYPLGRVGKSEEVADAILFLASDKSSFITGQTLGVDGGVLQAI